MAEEKDFYGQIYIISNDVNEKLYIGQTTKKLEERFKQHFYADSAIGNAMRKYGIEHFEIWAIEKCCTKEQQNAFEVFWIRELGTLYPEGYNLTIGGEGIVNPSEEIRRQISATKTGRPGRPQTENEKLQRSETVKAYWASHPEELQDLTERMRGNTYGTRQKGSKRTPEQKARMSAAQKAYRMAHPEAGQQHSEKLKAYWAKKRAEK